MKKLQLYNVRHVSYTDVKSMNSKTLAGVTLRFSGNGRKLGYPTANITDKTNLDDGIYFGYATLGVYRRHPAMIFVGTPVTVGDSTRRVEAHLLDIEDKDMYDQNLQLEILHFYRPNKKFATVGELITAMHTDETSARAWYKEHPLALESERG